MKPLVALTIALLLPAPLALAEEAPPPPEAVQAARIGRLLLADDETQRAEGEALLLERVAKGGDLKAFVRTMANAARRWANDEHRLVETWIRQAVQGDLDAREQAVRLITAMGEKAVMRLALELRHRTRHAGLARDEPEPPTPVAPPQVAAKPHMPRVYDVTALKQRGLNPVQVVSFLRKEANASEVGSGPTRFVIYADTEGHERLAQKLAEIRAEVARARSATANEADAKQPQADAIKPNRDTEPPPPGGEAPPPAPPPMADLGADTAAAEPVPAAALPEPAPDLAGPRWTVQPLVVRVPRDASLAKHITGWPDVDVDVITPFLDDAEQSKRNARPTSATVAGTLAAVTTWIEKAPALPEARTSYGERITIVPGREAQGFVGKRVSYRRTVRQAKEHGAWRVDQDILQSGLELRFQLTAGAEALKLRVDARLSEVSKPMATTQVRPEKGAEPIELDLPEWNRRSRSDTFEIPIVGGGLLMAMPDPAKADTGLVLILLRVEPEPQMLQNNANPNGAGAPGRREGN